MFSLVILRSEALPVSRPFVPPVEKLGAENRLHDFLGSLNLGNHVDELDDVSDAFNRCVE
jgi:hypothetical protein